METYLNFLERRAALVLGVLAAVTLFFGLQLGHLSNDSNPYLLAESHPARRSILEMQQEFSGTFDAAMVAVHNPEGVFNRTTLNAVLELNGAFRRMMLAPPADGERLRHLAAKHGPQAPEFARSVVQLLQGGLEQNDYLAAAQLAGLATHLPLGHADRAFLQYLPRRLNPIKEMAGLAATDSIITEAGTLRITKALQDTHTSPAAIQAEIMGNALMRNSVVSPDGTVTLLTVELFIKQDDADGQLRAYEMIRSTIDSYRMRHPEFHDEVYIAGVPIFIAEQKRLTDRDLGTLLPLVVVVVAVVLILYFRRPLGVLLPLLNVVLCTVWTLGAMSLLEVPMDLVTSALPVFLVTICGADAIHLMNEYYTQRACWGTGREAIRTTMRSLVSPVVLTTVTTVAGFLFSTATNISSIRVFGAFMVVGLVSAQIISLFLIPAWLYLAGGKHTPSQTDKSSNSEWLGRWLEWGLVRLIPRRRLALGVFLAVLAGAAILASRIKVEDAGSSYFAPDNIFRRADEFINRHIAGTSPGWIQISGDGANAMLKQETVAFLDRLDQFLLSQPNVTYTYSLATYLKRLHLALNDMKPEFNRVPGKVERVAVGDAEVGSGHGVVATGDEMIAQLVLLYENGGGNELNNVLNRDFSKAATLFTMNTTRATEYQALLKSVDRWMKENQPDHLAVRLAGTPVIWSGVLREIIKGQITSILLALAAVGVVLMLWLRSWKLGLLCSLPLAATMVVYYGAMAACGIELNIGTALISFVVVGIVDYSVHYLHRIREQVNAGNGLETALVHAIRNSGASIAFNVVVFSLGFLTLLCSQFRPIAYLGGLVALALAISGFMSLFVISLLAPWLIPPSPRPKPVADGRSKAAWPEATPGSASTTGRRRLRPEILPATGEVRLTKNGRSRFYTGADLGLPDSFSGTTANPRFPLVVSDGAGATVLFG